MGPCALWLGKDFSFSLVMFGLLAIYLQVSGLLFVFLSYSGYFGLFSLFQHFSISRAIFCVELFSDFFLSWGNFRLYRLFSYYFGNFELISPLMVFLHLLRCCIYFLQYFSCLNCFCVF